MTQFSQTIHPRQYVGIILQDARHRRQSTGKPKRVIARKIGETRLLTQQELSPFEHLIDSKQITLEITGRVLRRESRTAASHGFSVGRKHCTRLRRLSCKQLGSACWLEVISHGRAKECGIRPLSDDARTAFAITWKQTGCRCEVLQGIGDQGGVTNHFVSHLQNWYAAIAASQCLQVGLRHDRGL